MVNFISFILWGQFVNSTEVHCVPTSLGCHIYLCSVKRKCGIHETEPNHISQQWQPFAVAHKGDGSIPEGKLPGGIGRVKCTHRNTKSRTLVPCGLCKGGQRLCEFRGQHGKSQLIVLQGATVLCGVWEPPAGAALRIRCPSGAASGAPAAASAWADNGTETDSLPVSCRGGTVHTRTCLRSPPLLFSGPTGASRLRVQPEKQPNPHLKPTLQCQEPPCGCLRPPRGLTRVSLGGVTRTSPA